MTGLGMDEDNPSKRVRMDEDGAGPSGAGAGEAALVAEIVRLSQAHIAIVKQLG